RESTVFGHGRGDRSRSRATSAHPRCIPTHEPERRRHLSLPAARAAPPASYRPFPQPGPSQRLPSWVLSPRMSSEWDRQLRLVCIYDEHREELGRLRLAGIGAHAVAVAGQLGEALSGLVGRHRSVVDLTEDLALEHGRVDEGGFGMRVTRRVAARAVFDEHALDAL